LFSVAADPRETPDSGGAFSYYLGSSGSEVKDINDRLLELGYPICEVGRDFGAQTEFAVSQFQIVNALEADGVVGPKTWEILFSEKAMPALQSETQANISSPIEVGSSEDLAYDGKNLWVARNDFGAQNDALSRIDPVSGSGISRIEIEELEGGSRHLHPKLVYPAKDMLWVGGRASSGTETGTPTIVAIKTSGKLLGDPLYVGTSNIEVSNVVGFFSENNTVWAVVNEPHTVLYALSASPVKIVRRLPLNDIYNATGATFDGTTLWLSAYKGNSLAVWAVNLENGAVGKVLGVCTEKLAYDGRWVWALQQGQITAIDPENQQIMSAGEVQGWPRAITSNGKNQIWILTSFNADTFFQSLKTR
jgi:peptidoglycan hydrolase-like protein with peptidoglycan-binding domain